MDVPGRDAVAKGSAGDFFNHGSDELARRFKIGTIRLFLHEVRRQVTFSNLTGQSDDGRVLALTEDVFQFDLRDAWDL